MEGAATAEIWRSQVWQWIRTPKGKLEDGRKVTAEMVRALIPEELAKVKTEVGGEAKTYDRAAVFSFFCYAFIVAGPRIAGNNCMAPKVSSIIRNGHISAEAPW